MRVRRIVETARDVRVTLHARFRADDRRTFDEGWDEDRAVRHHARDEADRPHGDAAEKEKIFRDAG
jgi:hypothetical protein